MRKSYTKLFKPFGLLGIAFVLLAFFTDHEWYYRLLYVLVSAYNFYTTFRS